jgi:hypothetical protein
VGCGWVWVWSPIQCISMIVSAYHEYACWFHKWLWRPPFLANVSNYFMFAVRDEWWPLGTVRWLTHTNTFLIFPDGAFGGKNYINGSLDASRRDTSIAVIGIANRVGIKKLIFCILVIKSTKNVFPSAPSPFALSWNDWGHTWYSPIHSHRDGLQTHVCCTYRLVRTKKCGLVKGDHAIFTSHLFVVSTARWPRCHHRVVTALVPSYPPCLIWWG